MQGSVLIDSDGEFYEVYSHQLDLVAARFLRVRDAACNFPFTHPLRWSRMMRGVRANLPFAPNMSEPEWIPTRLMQFFDTLQKYFPAHKLLLSDFHTLPDAVPGINAPVVQTRYQRQTVPVSTPMVCLIHDVDYDSANTKQVQQGYFDIFFPTDFEVMEGLYRAITGKLTKVFTHEDFMKRWAYVEHTTTQNGDNPLLSWLSLIHI